MRSWTSSIFLPHVLLHPRRIDDKLFKC